jgi:putative transposase
MAVANVAIIVGGHSGPGAAIDARPAFRLAHATGLPMSRYRRANIEGGTLFFTVTLADRSSDVLVRHIDRLQHIYLSVQQRWAFETVAICVLPDHILQRVDMPIFLCRRQHT